MNLLKSIDLFGTDFNFTIFGKDNYNSLFGGFLTVLVVTATIIFSIMFGRDMISRKNPKVMIDRVVPQNSNYIECNLTNFPIFWRITDDYNNAINFSNYLYPDSVFYVYYFNKTINNFDLIKNISLPNKMCTREMINDDEIDSSRVFVYG